MLRRQEKAIERVVKSRAAVAEAWRRVDAEVYNAVRVQGIPVRVLAAELGLTRARVYQMLHNGAAQLDK